MEAISFLILLLLNNSDVSLRYGVNTPLETGMQASIAVETPISEHFASKVELGAIADRGTGAGGYSFVGLGPKLKFKPFVVKSFWSIGGITHPDAKLGGHFQFSHDIGVGVNSDGTGIGVGWKHISSAGLSMPNRGRDAILLEWTWNLGQ